MTDARKCKIPRRIAKGPLASVLFLCLAIYYAVFISGRITDDIIAGMHLAVFTVLPSAIPYMIVTDLYSAYGYPEKIGILGKITSRVFNMPGCCVRALLLGNLAGFPVGARVACDVYKSGGIDKKDCEKLIAYSNNPSIPFIVSVVGIKMQGSAKIGMALLIIVYISTVLTAILYKSKSTVKDACTPCAKNTFSLTKSVKSAAAGAISITAFITVFFGILGILRLYIKSDLALALMCPVLEITNAASLLTSSALPSLITLPLLAFALGFGGLSVMMQTAIFTKDTGTSLVPYFKIKLTEGLISAILAAVWFAAAKYLS